MSRLHVNVCGLAVILGSTGWGQVTVRVYLNADGVPPNGPTAYEISSVSADGRYVAFDSYATNLVAGDTNGSADVFLRDRQDGITERESVDSFGVQGNDHSYAPRISADGRYIAFGSKSTNLVTGDTNGVADVFVRDRQSGTTERVSVDSSGVQGNAPSYDVKISTDGRYVAFMSYASNLVLADTNGHADIFLRDRQNGSTERISVDSFGLQANADCLGASISGDGRYVTYYSQATNLVLGDTNGFEDAFVRDRQSGTTQLVSVSSSGEQGNWESSHYAVPHLSTDGRFVAFISHATNLVVGGTNGYQHVFVRDLQNSTTQLVSVSSSGAQANYECYHPSISADGRYVTFWSTANNLITGDTNGSPPYGGDVFVRDLQNGTTERVSVGSQGTEGNESSFTPEISADGRHVGFWSIATNLVPGDTDGIEDLFVRDLDGGPSFSSLCDPGVIGVIACPCSNAPSSPGRGCENSAATGGAILSASGGTYLSSDSLVFTTRAEKPNATSIVMQGTAYVANGLVFGQGVRCVGGALKRLYTKTAIGGRIIAPNFGAGDPAVSSRSTALGDTILPGQSRWYLVYYRDPIVLGGCPSSSTFNATQTGQVAWSL